MLFIFFSISISVSSVKHGVGKGKMWECTSLYLKKIKLLLNLGPRAMSLLIAL